MISKTTSHRNSNLYRIKIE